MIAIEIFKLFGTIFLKSDEADKTLDRVDKRAKSTGDRFSSMIGTVGKWGLAVGAAAGTAAIALGVKAFNASEDLQKALNGLQAETGVTTEVMEGMRDAMLDIYNNNFGESFEDIGKSMALISQQTGLANKELADTTKNAIAIKDTFGIEVSESIRAVNQLMKNFGISSEEAYNLIAQGAQWGLDANENLADTINEYSLHFAQLGLSANDMFNSLVNGAQSGVFDIDKLGDAVKEFGIRTKDSSDATNMAFAALGLNAQKIGDDFAQGGEKGKKAFEIVTQKLNELQDPMKQNQIGVALFGTMFEDVGAKGIKALTDVRGEIDSNLDVLKEINKVKYNTFTEAITGIGRQFETSVFIPLGEKILPILNRFANWISDNMPTIQKYAKIALEVIETGFNIVYDFITDYVLPVFDQLRENTSFNFDTVKKIIKDVTDVIVKYIIPPLIKIFEFVYKELIPAVVNTFISWWPRISNIIQDVWAIIKSVLEALQIIFEAVFPIIKDVVITSIGIIKDVIGGFVRVLEGVIQFIAGVFTGDWSKAWEGIKNIVGGVFDGLKGIVKGAINYIIDMLNSFVHSANAIIGKMNEVPGVSLPNIPTIPRLAKGGIITNAGSVMVGEQGPEILNLPKGASVVPLNKASAGGGITVNIYNPNLFDDSSADKLGDLLVDRLKILGLGAV